MRVLGLDPGLRNTGWGVIDVVDNVADGVVKSDASLSLAERLVQLFDGVVAVIGQWSPEEAAVEETFVNKNPESTLKLGQARGVCLLALARTGMPVAEYATRLVKKALVGTGAAEKAQIQAMLKVLLPGVKLAGADAADALAVAITHASMMRG